MKYSRADSYSLGQKTPDPSWHKNQRKLGNVDYRLRHLWNYDLDHNVASSSNLETDHDVKRSIILLTDVGAQQGSGSLRMISGRYDITNIV